MTNQTNQTDALAHQANQPFPKLDSPIADIETGLVTIPWYFLFIWMWQQLGGGSGPSAIDSAVLQPAMIATMNSIGMDL